MSPTIPLESITSDHVAPTKIATVELELNNVIVQNLDQQEIPPVLSGVRVEEISCNKEDGRVMNFAKSRVHKSFNFDPPPNEEDGSDSEAREAAMILVNLANNWKRRQIGKLTETTFAK